MTHKPLHYKDSCKFFFVVCFDQNGFYVKRGIGNHMHSGHRQLDNLYNDFPSNLLQATEEELVRDVLKSNIPLGAARTILYQKSGKVVNRQKLAHLKKLQQSIHEIGQVQGSSTEKMMSYLDNKKYEYMLLIHNKDDRNV